VSVTEPSDAVKTGMVKQYEGRLRSQFFGWLVVWITFIARGTVSQDVGK
jgi:hypothetical protein